MRRLKEIGDPGPTRQCVDPIARKLPLDHPANIPGNPSSFANFSKNRQALRFEILFTGVLDVFGRNFKF